MQYVVMREQLKHRETRMARLRVLKHYPKSVKRLGRNDRQWYVINGPYYSGPKEKEGVYAQHTVTQERAFLALEDVEPMR
ncbi:MAG: hypothetical protein CMN80_11090 [Spongiibacter sp.]|uniref:hypothetical protein n=1 Tax=Spongiibacter sp. TaxID=2024860 RepID=UPI000C092B57|nr:hypothetical protein [Spongiibacter sp.]MAK44681.1 hypothetical protein [Spongiibacter sp.]|tara:strand:- start:816 stop:1055 length:240 start_codon:yes stop_codon:yes gene_type:complete